MRLDHLLSTEFSGRRSGVRRVAHAPGMVPGFGVGVLVWKRSLASRVLGAGGEWYGYAFGFPDRHPHPFWVRAVFRMPWRDAVGLAGRGSGPVGARGGLRTG